MNVNDFNRALIMSSRLYPLLSAPILGPIAVRLMAALCLARCKRLERVIDMMDRARVIREAESC